MSTISFRVLSIDLKDSTLHRINQKNPVRLNLTQRPSHNTEEYLLKNVSYLKNINHEFVIEDPLNKLERLTLTVHDETPKMRKPKDRSVDHYIQGCKENRDGYVDCECVAPKHSLIGYRNINTKESEKGVNNTLRIELFTNGDVESVGFANLAIYIWGNSTQVESQQKVTQSYNEPIMFVDPGCPAPSTQGYAY